MLSKIQSLFEDVDGFAKIIADIKLPETTFEVYTFNEGHFAIELIVIPRRQFKDCQEAFAAIFKKKLFDAKQWNDGEDYDSADEAWLIALREHWIPEYLLKRHMVALRKISGNQFIKRLTEDLETVKASREEAAIVLKRLANPEVLQIRKGSTYDHLFGISSEVYFNFEWNIVF